MEILSLLVEVCMGEDVWGVEDAVFYMLASDHVLEAKEDEL